MIGKNDNLKSSTAMTPPMGALMTPAALGVQRGMVAGDALEKMARDYLAGCRRAIVAAATEMADNGSPAMGEEYLRAFDQTVQARIDASRTGIPLRVSVQVNGQKTEVAYHGG